MHVPLEFCRGSKFGKWVEDGFSKMSRFWKKQLLPRSKWFNSHYLWPAELLPGQEALLPGKFRSTLYLDVFGCLSLPNFNCGLVDFYPIQCGAPKIAKLVYNSNNYGLWYLYLTITIVVGVYKPTYNWGAPHCKAHQYPHWEILGRGWLDHLSTSVEDWKSGVRHPKFLWTTE